MQIHVAPIHLDSALPIHGGQPFRQHDAPITFLHVHDCLEVGYCYSGSGIFMIGDKVLPFHAGDVSFINHTEVHLARSAPGSSSEWTWIYLDPLRLVGRAAAGDPALLDPTRLGGPMFGNLLSANRHPAVNQVVLRLIQELRNPEPGQAEALRALAWELMVLVQRLRPREGEGVARTPRRDYDRIAPALQWVAQHFAEPVNIPRLATVCGLSAPQFRRVFQRSIGQSPRQYWLGVRLQLATSLLRTTSRSILEICHDTGFETLSSFNRLFREYFQTTPSGWRAGQKSKATVL